MLLSLLGAALGVPVIQESYGRGTQGLSLSTALGTPKKQQLCVYLVGAGQLCHGHWGPGRDRQRGEGICKLLKCHKMSLMTKLLIVKTSRC